MNVGNKFPTGLVVLGTLSAWGITSLVESNASIFAVAATMLLLGIVAARLVDRNDTSLRLFGIAYAMRTLFALIAYFSGKGQAYWVGGAGSDAIAYYNTSFMDLSEAVFEFSYKGFPAYNNFITHWALRFDNAHYLCNLQGTVIAGALLVVLVRAVVAELSDRQTGDIVALIVAVHPALIVISAVLLRDALVGMFGWATMLLFIRLFRIRTLGAAVLHLTLIAGTLLMLSYLRLQSMMAFVAFSLVALILAKTGGAVRRGSSSRLRTAVIIVGSCVGAAAVVVVLSGKLLVGLDSQYFRGVVEYRLENAAQGSLGASLASNSLVLSTVMYSLLAMIAPFPFYGWAPEVLGHDTAPLDYLSGYGGLFNQLLFAFAVVGILRAVRQRNFGTMAWMLCIAGFVAFTTLGGGDTLRYVAVHVFPLYLITVVDGVRLIRLRPQLLLAWMGALISLYVLYETLKSGMDRSYLFLALGCFVLFILTYVTRAFRLAGVQGGGTGAMTDAGSRLMAPVVPNLSR